MPRLRPDVYLSHPSWFIIPSKFKDGRGSEGGTRQIRITCKEHAHQTDPESIQGCIVSRWEGGHIFAPDLDQIELRTAGLISGEPFFLNAYAQTPPLDVHSMAALRMWGPDEVFTRYPILSNAPLAQWKKLSADWKKRERQAGKRNNFSHLFRSGADKMQASVLGDIGELLPLHIFEKVVNDRQKDYPVLWDWQEGLIHTANTLGYLELPITGLSRSFGGGEKYTVNEIVNFPVQATAATAMLQVQSTYHALLEKSEWKSRILPFLNCYDAVYFDCDSDESLEAAKHLYTQSLQVVSTTGYWARLQDKYQRKVLLEAEFKTLKPRTPSHGQLDYSRCSPQTDRLGQPGTTDSPPLPVPSLG